MSESGQLKRGNLLWESSRMFLPEHREQLLEMRRRQQERAMPELDEDRLAELDAVLGEALAGGHTVAVTWAGRCGEERIVGRLTRLDPLQGLLRIESEDETKTLRFDRLLHAERIPGGEMR